MGRTATTDNAGAVGAGAESAGAAIAPADAASPAAPTLLDRALRAVAHDDPAGAALGALVRAAATGERAALPSLDAALWTPHARPLLDRLRRRLLAEAAQDGDAEAYREVHQWLVALERAHDHLLGDPLYRAVHSLGGDGDAGGAQLLVEVAHDMRSPLGAMLLLLDRVRFGHSGAVNDAQARQLGLVYGAALGLSQLAGDLMDLVRGGGLSVGPPPAPYDLTEVLRGVHDIVRPMAEEKGLDFAVYGPAGEGPRLGYGAALSRVLLNLTTNACKYTDAGRVELAVVELERDLLECTVRDSGRGLPAAVAAFLRGDAPAGSAPPASGLGLAICRKLVAAMGGTMTVATGNRGGTRITCLVPAPSVAHA